MKHIATSGGINWVANDERTWIIPCAALIAAQAAILTLIAAACDFPIGPPLIQTFIASVPITGAGIIFVAIRANFQNPLQGLDQELPTARVLIVGLVLGTIQASMLSWSKTLMPFYSGGYWADPILANLDYRIFHTDPWRLARSLPGGPFIQWCYAAWIPLMTLAHVSVMISRPSWAKSRVILCSALIIAFGSLFQFVLPSAGPMFYDLAGFGDRYWAMFDGAQPVTFLARKWLWYFHVQNVARAGGGISAMPSMHVAEALWLALACKTLWRKLYPIALAFFAVVCLGSVYLGFHYASDSFVGAAAALVIWCALGWSRSTRSRLQKQEALPAAD
jgi:membrane-associated phospholipid phosphatase